MNWDYISGYFDGEGSAYITNQDRAYLSWANTHLESLEAMRDFMGVGTIRQSHKGERSWYSLAIWRVDDLRRVIPELQTRCIIKLPALAKIWEHSKDKVAQPKGQVMARREDILQWYGEGIGGHTIAKKLGCHPTSVYYVINKSSKDEESSAITEVSGRS